MAITKAGESQSFDYTGNIQKFTVPFTGIYKLEVYGAKGGAGVLGETGGAAGGYSVGYTKLTAGDILYVAVGGAGGNTPQTYDSRAYGGWNGGGDAPSFYAGGGGGATHIALNSNRGELKNYANYKSEVLIVAGGGGGSAQGTLAYDYEGKWYSYAVNAFGGTGGGSSGGTGTYVNNSNGSNTGSHNNGGQVSGTQTAAGTGGGFGYGGSASDNAWGAGGGGWYGGGRADRINAGGGGGSGYIGNVPSFVYKGTTYAPSTENGKRNGNGTATITYISKTTLFYFNGNEVTDLIYNGTNITSLTFDGTKIF